MKHEIPIRIKVVSPPAGIRIMVQRGPDELLPPTELSADAAFFDFAVAVDMTESIPNFLGKYAQGPKKGRFIYVNSGQSAMQWDTLFARRAKISLTTITARQIEAIIKTEGLLLFAEYLGTGRDGGPTCASVKGIEWTVAEK